MNIYEKFLNKIDWIYNVNMSRHIKKKLKVNILEFDESIDSLIKDKSSLARFGDGEFTLMLNGEFLYNRNISLRFQKANPQLKQRMIDILKDKDISKYNLKLAVPIALKEYDETSLVPDAYTFWENYLRERRYKITKLLEKQQVYIDTLITRFYMDFADKDSRRVQKKVNQLKKLWDGEDLLIVEGEGSRLGVNNDLFDNSLGIKRILCPNKDAFDYYDEILKTAIHYGQNKVIILALGPTATVLAYDLARAGLRALDLGHIDIEYQWFLMKATEKVAVQGKVITEVSENQSDDGGFVKTTGLRDEDVLCRIIAK
ncbi:DUF1792 domain-containing protein [Elizabethkingia meningoseptica]|uniref:GT-D fold domain-containing glycosyltransferase n=2 Tax=Elizabethkingia meningoseptica TaxID=238 RepID=UPI0023AEA4DC|nr:GT-D fold domain-containing glycosyltransferase [Elizabethkingia meningoseptica]MDE5438547.1 DUF1792 domain-containing protein [Elizabethkingia meningoseptica]MDE5507618.1 DUF1792 domain-containing protein [Elizabethkingia meningoseptica]MDE5526777.1 DUF1792 domain-containing protein [Elizabethkingia meningoseptica]MDE5530783.1 DUF1792 domain-containing protein [Elizabethkingia meningoseptica]MDE5534340.1 DUF1792 domain-containing protein [Elizabethkingia meningoseptica]